MLLITFVEEIKVLTFNAFKAFNGRLDFLSTKPLALVTKLARLDNADLSFFSMKGAVFVYLGLVALTLAPWKMPSVVFNFYY